MNYYRRYIGDYRRCTGSLSIAEHGVYTILLDEYYARNGVIPLHPSQLNILCHATTKIEKEAVLRVAQDYFPSNDGKRHNKRADEELAISLKAIEKMREGGKKGMNNRYGKY